MSTSAADARRLWMLFEPIHAVSYFTDQSRAAFTAAGFRGFWRGYFAGRAAPLGRTGPATVTALFYSFAPAMVERAIPAVWSLAAPEVALRARREGAAAALRDVLTDDARSVVEAALPALEQAVNGMDCSGRGLAAANQALALPDEPFERLWQLCTVLREHRGDGHIAALVGHDLDGCEALAWRCSLDLDRTLLQPARGWTDEQWDAAVHRIRERGLLTENGEATTTSRATQETVERLTDEAAARPWRSMPATTLTRLEEQLARLYPPLTTAIPARNPIGLPRYG